MGWRVRPTPGAVGTALTALGVNRPQGCSKALTIVPRRLRAEVASEFEGLLGAPARQGELLR